MKKLFCDFCGKPSDDVMKMIASSHGAHICNECVAVCVDMLLGGNETAAEKPEGAMQPTLDPLGNEWRQMPAPPGHPMTARDLRITAAILRMRGLYETAATVAAMIKVTK